jgi:hypothetical protein
MSKESQEGIPEAFRCANPSCDSRVRQDEDGFLGWLSFGSTGSSGYFLGKNWLCSESCLSKQVNEGILRSMVRPNPGSFFKPMGPRIGTFLRAKGWITSEQLNEALELQKQYKMKLGKCLLKMDYLSEDKLLTGLSEQLKIPCIFDPISNLAEEALRAVPKSVCMHFRLVPFEYRQGHILSVAADIDLNEEIILAVQEILRCSIQPYLTTREAIRDLLERFVRPVADDPVTLFENTSQLNDEMGALFLREWTQAQADRARFASVEGMVWFRYLNASSIRDHLLIAESAIPTP